MPLHPSIPVREYYGSAPRHQRNLFTSKVDRITRIIGVTLGRITIDSSYFKASRYVYKNLVSGDFYTAMLRFDGLRFAENKHFSSTLNPRRHSARSEGLLPSTRRRLKYGSKVCSEVAQVLFENFSSRLSTLVGNRWLVCPVYTNSPEAGLLVKQSRSLLSRSIDQTCMPWSLINRPVITIPGNIQIIGPPGSDKSLSQLIARLDITDV